MGLVSGALVRYGEDFAPGDGIVDDAALDGVDDAWAAMASTDHVSPRSMDDGCVSWDTGRDINITDWLDNDCTSYEYDVNVEGINPDAICGIWDDDDFTASEFCCACGGGWGMQGGGWVVHDDAPFAPVPPLARIAAEDPPMTRACVTVIWITPPPVPPPRV